MFSLIYKLNTSKKEDHQDRWKDPRVHLSDARQTMVRQSRLAIGSPTPLTLSPPKNREKNHISINVDYLLTPSSVSMFIEGLSLEACHAAQAERRSANTAMAPASAAAVAAAERASSVSPPFFALSPLAKIDSIASPPTPASADGPTSAIAGSLTPLVYAEDFIEGGRWWGGGALAGQ